ncbi:MAG: FAD-dependent oxidoreductase, partial [Solirubrobacteraceae bacterium]
MAHNWNCTQCQLEGTVIAMNEITVIGGGVAGLAAAITCAESGADVKLFEAHQQLGGRARSTDGSY